MPMTNYPAGFMAGLSVRGIPLLQSHPGNVFWVGNGPSLGGGPSSSAVRVKCVGGSDNNHGSFNRPFATLAYALSQCVQGNGDIVIIKPGHVEFVNGAGTTKNVTDPTGNIVVSAQNTLALNVAGVAVIGLGSGPLRPTFYFDTAATANVPVRSANMSLQNLLFKHNFADIASLFTGVGASVTASIAANIMTVTVVGSGTLYPGASIMGTGILDGTIILNQLTGTAGGVGTYTVSVNQTFASGTITTGEHDFNIESCEFRDISSILNALTIYTSSSTARSSDGFRFVGNRIKSLGTTAATTALVMAAAQDRVTINDNYGNWAVLNDTAAMLATGANNITQFEFARNAINRPNTSTTSGLAISTSGTAWTGHCYDNRIWGLNNTAQIWINTGTKLAFSQNFCPITAAADKSGLINPAAV